MKTVSEVSPLRNLRDCYDIIVIGGGIQGATLCREAALQGYSVVLLEQNDFGSGVSANSLKIVHGGIRYLQSLDLPRMRQSICEQRMLLQIAPHLVHPLRCVIPAYGGGGKGRLALGLGTALYDIMAIDRNKGLDPANRLQKSCLLSVREIKKLLPLLDHAGTSGGAEWWDAMVNDSERLVLCFVMSAREKGADVCNHVRADSVFTENGRASGVMAHDVLTGDRVPLRARVVMDCTGPWYELSQPADRQYVKAMNLLIRKPLARIAFGARSVKKSDGMLFFVPWKAGTMAGTWYSRIDKDSDPGKISADRLEIDNALDDVNSVFAGLTIARGDITAVHLGLLPALSDARKRERPGPSSRFSITDQAGRGAAGLIRVQGVKYTTARDVSAKALGRALPYLDTKARMPSACPLRLYGNETRNVVRFRRSCMQRYTPEFSTTHVTRLMDNYGTHVHAILAYAQSDPDLGLPVPGAPNVMRAELAFVIDHEMVRTLSDLIFRRTDLGTFAMPPAGTIAFCADFTADRLGWDDETKKENILALWQQLPLWLQTPDGQEHAGISDKTFEASSINHAMFSVCEEV